MTTATQSLVAITPAGVLDDRYIAGHFFWYSIEEGAMPLHKVRRAFRDNGLDETRLPRARRPEHVMQEACSSIRGVTVDEPFRTEIRAEQIERDKEHIVYEIGRQVQHRATREIHRANTFRANFDIATASLAFELEHGTTEADVKDLIGEVSERYDASAARLPGRKLREVVRHYVEAAGAENVGRGGVYFIAKTVEVAPTSKLHAYHGNWVRGGEFVQRVRMMLEDVYGTSPNFHAAPVINDEAQREFLRRIFIENCSVDLRAFSAECSELIKARDQRKRNYRVDMRDGMKHRRDDFDRRRARFEEILDEPLDELSGAMTRADAALAKFLQEAGE